MIPVNECDPPQDEMTQFVSHDIGKNLRRIGTLPPSRRLYSFVERIGQSTYTFVSGWHRTQSSRYSSFEPAIWTGNDEHRQARE